MLLFLFNFHVILEFITCCIVLHFVRCLQSTRSLFDVQRSRAMNITEDAHCRYVVPAIWAKGKSETALLFCVCLFQNVCQLWTLKRRHHPNYYGGL